MPSLQNITYVSYIINRKVARPSFCFVLCTFRQTTYSKWNWHALESESQHSKKCFSVEIIPIELKYCTVYISSAPESKHKWKDWFLACYKEAGLANIEHLAKLTKSNFTTDLISIPTLQLPIKLISFLPFPAKELAFLIYFFPECSLDIWYKWNPVLVYSFNLTASKITPI